MANDAFATPKLQEFRFRLEVNGLPVALCQSFDPGVRKNGIVKVFGGGMNHPWKEVGMVEFEDAVLSAVIPVAGAGRDYFETWANDAQNVMTGKGNLAFYYKDMTLHELDNQMNPVRTWDFHYCQVSQQKLGKRDGSAMDKVAIDEIHIAYVSRELTVH